MAAPVNLLILGASARAAAFSALRAGLQPWCADLFADADLQAHCSISCIAALEYPQAFRAAIRKDVTGPWLFTGGLENHSRLIDEWSTLRTLWGNTGAAIRRARDPGFWPALLGRAGCPCPATRTVAGRYLDEGRWLVKPVAGAGGTGIHLWNSSRPARRVYFQQHIAGPAYSAVFVGDGTTARLLGVTRQLVGEAWLHAGPFRYCGSFGPSAIGPPLADMLRQLGHILAEGCGLRGLFGVDWVLHDGQPYPVEINPRYTASIEVLEYATGLSALNEHRAIFDATAGPSPGSGGDRSYPKVVGKAILFADRALSFPHDGPWLAALRQPPSAWQVPGFGDVPHPGDRIEARRPILTLFAEAESETECEVRLRQTAADIDRLLR
jgi:uncharacterized protein